MNQEVPNFELELEGSYSLTNDMNINDIGKLEELTDAIVMLFQNIDKQLNSYLVSCDETQKKELHKKMSRFLARLNTNRMLPLSFRLKSLRAFSKEARFLDADLTAAILNSYKVGIEIVRAEAKGRENYLLELGNLCGESISLASLVARLQLEAYNEPHTQITRQVHELFRIGIAALGKFSANNQRARNYREKINHSITWYELMREADFFQLTREGQRLIYDSLEPYIKQVMPMYCPREHESPSLEDHAYLIAYVGGKQEKPRFVRQLRQRHEKDRIILDITQLLPILQSHLKEAEAYMHGGGERKVGKRKLRTEDEVNMLYQVTRHMLRCLHITPHKHPRQQANGEVIRIISNVEMGLRMPHKGHFAISNPTNKKDERGISVWNMRDISPAGTGLETAVKSDAVPEVTALVRLVWGNKEGSYPFWAQVRWRRHLLKGQKIRLGLQFLPRNVQIWWTQDVGTRNNHPVLGIPMKRKNHVVVWSTDTRLKVGSSLILNIKGKLYACKVIAVPQRGCNFHACQAKVVRPF
ncbi:MAG: hypothetical protein R8K21_08740 [Mariprofundales bacterium]